MICHIDHVHWLKCSTLKIHDVENTQAQKNKKSLNLKEIKTKVNIKISICREMYK